VRSGTKNRAATVRERFSTDDTAPLPYGRGSDMTSHTRSKSTPALQGRQTGRPGASTACHKGRGRHLYVQRRHALCHGLWSYRHRYPLGWRRCDDYR